MSFSLFLKGIFRVFIIFLKSLSFVWIPCLISIIIIIIVYFFYFIKYRYVEHFRPVGKRVLIKERSILKRIFLDFPKRLAYDYVHQDYDDFSEFGIHMVIGKQGAGKSTTVAYLLRKWKKIYPNLQIYTNMGYKYEDDVLDQWRQLITRTNGKKGVVNVIDDIKAWWSNADSKNLPPEVLAEICQQRKQKKAILCTIQVFSELPKAFRSQTHTVYIPTTFFGCLTVVKKSDIKYYNPDKEKFTKTRGMFFFVHSKEIRDSFDTYKKIEKYKDVEWDVSPYFASSLDGSDTSAVKTLQNSVDTLATSLRKKKK